jgi:hypothetical protein
VVSLPEILHGDFLDQVRAALAKLRQVDGAADLEGAL